MAKLHYSHKGAGLTRLTIGKGGYIKFAKDPNRFNRHIGACMRGATGTRAEIQRKFTGCVESYRK